MAHQKISGIYKIQSIVHPERIYIGSAVDIRNRWYKHKSWMSLQINKNPKLQAHYNKYGIDDFIFSIVAICDREDLIPIDNIIWIEQCFIWAYHYKGDNKPWFNVNPWAGSSINRPCPEEQKERLRIVNTGKKASEETKQKMSETRLGVKRGSFTPEHILHISQSKKGIPSPMKGKKTGKPSWNSGKTGVYSEETLKKIRAPRPKAKEGVKKSWIKRKEEGKIGERDEFGRFKKKKE